MRVYELAREYKMKSKDFLAFLEKDLGLAYPSHMSAVSESEEKKIRQKMAGHGTAGQGSSGKAEPAAKPANKPAAKPAAKPASSPAAKGHSSREGQRNEHRDGGQRSDHRDGQRSDRREGQRSDHRDGQRSDHREGQRNDHRDGRRDDRREGQRNDHRDGRREDRSGTQAGKPRPHQGQRPNAHRSETEEGIEKPSRRPEKKHKPRRDHDQGSPADQAEARDFKRKKSERPQEELETLNRKPPKKKKGKKNKKENKPVEIEDDFTDIIEIPADITVGDFAKAIRKNAMEVIGELIKMGVMAGLNDSINFETAESVAEKLGVLITEPEKKDKDEIFDQLDFEDKEEDLKPRPPVVTVMGHVDHGKTSLLDQIRKTNVTRGEAGGITQHIGASEVEVKGHKITFLDTPGHEAFTEMRAHGAETTDIVILVVAADDGVMPQTVEAINHAKAANVPIIVAINKMDKYGADPNRVMQELTEYGLVAEEWGGDTVMMPISAKTGQGVEDLLEMIITVAELQELKANPNRPAVGVVIEAQLEQGRGATASVLVQKGTLHDTDYVVSGLVSGHIRVMYDAHGHKIHKALPAQAAKIVGLSDLPEAGDAIYAVSDEKVARDLAAQAQERERMTRLNATTHVSLDELHNQISVEGLKELNVIVKTDVKGTIDALASSLEKMSTDEVRVNIIHGAVGGISESDVLLAAASNAIIIGFNVRPNQGALAQAERENIDIRTYRVIYEALDDIEAAIKGMLAPEIKEEVLGHAEVRDTFKVPNVGTVAGIYVTSGKMARSASVRLIRDDVIIYEGKISSLRRFKDDVKEVAQGYEGGLGIENYNDLKTGDQIECFRQVEVQAE